MYPTARRYIRSFSLSLSLSLVLSLEIKSFIIILNRPYQLDIKTDAVFFACVYIYVLKERIKYVWIVPVYGLKMKCPLLSSLLFFFLFFLFLRTSSFLFNSDTFCVRVFGREKMSFWSWPPAATPSIYCSYESSLLYNFVQFKY